MEYKSLLGAIVGDIFGQPYEFNRTCTDSLDFDFKYDGKFTDDTVCTIAIAEAIIINPENPDYESSLVKWCRKYPKAGYGAMFFDWFMCRDSERHNLNSYGNGSAMRVSPCGYYPTLQLAKGEAKRQAEITHGHPEGIKGAECVAELIYSAREYKNKESLLEIAQEYYPSYDFSKSIEELKAGGYGFNCTCQGSVPQAIRCVYEGTNYEDTIRRAIYLGGDTDTIGAIAGSIAYPLYRNMTSEMAEYAYSILPEEIIKVIEDFDTLFK